MADAPRIDKWLWAVRLFKTRSLASQACRSGKVKIEEQAVKPSRVAKTGDIVTVQKGPLTLTFRILELLHNRVGAKLVGQYLEDLTPEENYQQLKLAKGQSGMRSRSAGRPTKKERRELDQWFGSSSDDAGGA